MLYCQEDFCISFYSSTHIYVYLWSTVFSTHLCSASILVYGCVLIEVSFCSWRISAAKSSRDARNMRPGQTAFAQNASPVLLHWSDRYVEYLWLPCRLRLVISYFSGFYLFIIYFFLFLWPVIVSFFPFFPSTVHDGIEMILPVNLLCACVRDVWYEVCN